MIAFRPLALLSLLLAAVFPLASQSRHPTTEADALQGFAALHPIDEHVHIFHTGPEFQKMLQDEHLTVLNILVVDDTWGPRRHLQPQIDNAWRLVHGSQGHIKLCTTFDPYRFNDSAFPGEAIRQVNRDLGDGAVAVKIWKNVGMEIKNSQGKYILPDDSKLEPIYADLARHHTTLLAHLAEPDIAWEPIDVKKDPLGQYYLENPQWHMLNKPGVPSKQAILEARDRVLRHNPKLRVVGLHLGSMESNLDDLARHLERYPNFAVDTAARMEYLEFGNREKVRNLLLKYQDRFIYGTDLDVNPDADIHQSVQEWEQTYAEDWRFFATDDTFQIDGRTVRGLALPHSVLVRLYRTNAIHWIPGL